MTTAGLLAPSRVQTSSSSRSRLQLDPLVWRSQATGPPNCVLRPPGTGRERGEVRGVGERSRMSGEEADGSKPHQGGVYGTFQGPPSYPPPRPPPVGFPQPAPPPGLSAYHRGGYQAVSGRDYEAGVRGHSHDRLPCCGIGFGWFLFIFGFFLGAIPWYIGALLLWCSRVDYREKPGYVACTVAAILATIAVIIGAAAGTHVF